MMSLSVPSHRIGSKSSPMKSQKSKHGFYNEFSLASNANRSFKKGSLTLWEQFIKYMTPGPKETYCSTSYCSKFFNKSCALSLLPLFEWLPHYQWSWFKRDFMSGITVAILLVPQSLAYATLAGLPPEWGLYASVVPVLLYVLWSTSCSVAVGPVAPTAIMVASAVEGIMNNLGKTDDDELYQSIAMTLSFVCGIILIIFGVIRAGFIIVFLSRPVMTGFIMSAAFIILINQFRALFGLDMDRYPLFYQTLIAVFKNIESINWWTTLISAISLTVLFLPKCCLRGKVPKWLPIPLIVIVLFILISVFVDLEHLGVELVGGDITAGFPSPKAPNFDYIPDVFASSIIISIVSYMGSIALAKGFEQKTTETYKQQLNAYNEWYRENVDTMDDIKPKGNTDEIKHETVPNGDTKHTKHREPDDYKDAKEAETFSMQSTDDEEDDDDSGSYNSKPPTKPLDLPPIDLCPNMEFIAYGIANLLGSFFSSQVVSASFSRSALNFEMNGHTQMSSIIQAIICVLCLLFLMPLLSPLPKCVLASLVTVSVYRLIKNGVHEFIFLYKVSNMELVEFAVASIAPLVIGLEIGIFLGVGTSIVVNLLRHSFASIIFLGRLQSTMSDDAEYVDCALFKEAKSVPHITIIEIKAELSFSNNNRLIEKIRHLLASGNKYIVVSLNLTSFIDTTVIRQIVTIFEDAKGAFICLSQCRPKVFELMQRFENCEDEFPDNIQTFVSTQDAVLYLRSMRSKMMHISEAFCDDEESSLSCLSQPNLDYTGDTAVTSVIPGVQSVTMSDMDVVHFAAKKNTFSIRTAGRSQNKSHSTHDALESDSEDDDDESSGNIVYNKAVTPVAFDHKDSSTVEHDEDAEIALQLRIVNSLDIAKIYEGKEVDEFNETKALNGAHLDNKQSL